MVKREWNRRWSTRPSTKTPITSTAGMQIDEANEELDLDLPTGDYETVAGFILEALGHIPAEGEHLHHNSLRLLVTHVRGMRVEKVMVTKGNPDQGH